MNKTACACRVEPGSKHTAFRWGASRVQDAAGTKNRKSDLYVPRYTKITEYVRRCTSRSECYSEIYRDIPSYRLLFRAIPSYTHPGMYQVIPSIARYILWPTSGTPIKFFHGIYLVYTRYIPFPWICQGYTWYIPRICFPVKFLFASI